jgi:hypothetical protein
MSRAAVYKKGGIKLLQQHAFTEKRKALIEAGLLDFVQNRHVVAYHYISSQK